MNQNTTNEKAHGCDPVGFPETTTNKGQFTGTRNPRHVRVLIRLMWGRDVRREQIDEVAGASNGPDLIAELRRKGLHLPCDRIDAVDRDGKPCRPGVYWLTAADFRKIGDWLDGGPLFGASNG